jgi:hypothetical protein
MVVIVFSDAALVDKVLFRALLFGIQIGFWHENLLGVIEFVEV